MDTQTTITELDRFSNNLDEILSTLLTLYSSEPQSYIVRYLRKGDEEPTLMTFKNPAQYKEEILNAFTTESAFINKKVYVDSENGDDSNTGNGDDPVATVTAAINLLTNTVNGTIFFINDYEWKASELRTLYIYNKTLEFSSIENNTDVKLIFNIDSWDYDNYGSMISLNGNANLILSIDTEIKNTYSDDILPVIALSGGLLTINYNKGKMLQDGDSTPIVLTVNEKVALVNGLSGSVFINALKATMSDTDTSVLLNLRSNPIGIDVFEVTNTTFNDNDVTNKGELAKWVDSYKDDDTKSDGFILDGNNSNRAINAVCRDVFLQATS